MRTQRYTGNTPVAFSISQNLKTRHLTTGQRAAVGHAAVPLLEAEAKRRQAEAARATTEQVNAQVTGSALGADRHQAPDPELERRAPRAADRAARMAGTSGRSVARFKRVSEQAPDLAGKVRDGSMALDRAERVIRDREAEARRVEQARAEAAAEPSPTRGWWGHTPIGR